MKKLLCIILIVITVLLFPSCSKDVSVKVVDLGKESIIQTKTETKISEVLEQNNIKINSKDLTEPSLNAEITEKTTEIIIKRYAKVTIKKGIEQKTIEIQGGTVKEAVEKSGFKLENGEKTDKNLDDYLTNGMKINILIPKKVTLVVNGEKSKITTTAVTVKELFEEKKLTKDDDDELNVSLDTQIIDNMKITLDKIEYKQEKRSEIIQYSVKEKNSASMYVGESKIIQKGVNGRKEVLYKVKYVNGKENSKEKISEKIKKKSINQIVLKGTKSKTLTYEEAKRIANDYWKSAKGSSEIIIVEETPVERNGKKYYQCFLKSFVIDHYSTMDYLYINVETGDCLSTIR